MSALYCAVLHLCKGLLEVLTLTLPMMLLDIEVKIVSLNRSVIIVAF